MRVEIIVEGTEQAAAAVDRVAGNFNRSPGSILSQIAEHWRSVVFPRNLRAGGFAPLSPTTVRLRGATGPILDRGHGYPTSAVVLRSRDLEVEVGIPGGKAALLEFGGTTSPRSAIPNRRVPARPFVLLESGDVDDAESRIAEHYFRGIPK